MSKTIVITGCNRGLGLELAEYFLYGGYEVIGLNRTQSKLRHPKYLEIKYEANFNEKQLKGIKSKLIEVDILIVNMLSVIYFKIETFR